MSSTKDVAAIAADAQWLPAHWDQSRDTIRFACIPRQTHRALSFLADQYIDPLHPATVSAGIAQLAGGARSITAPNYIFHSAFCCSTSARSGPRHSRALDGLERTRKS